MSEKKHRFGKKFYLICAFLLLAAVLAAGFVFWYLPKNKLKDFRQDFLLKNQFNFRTDEVKSTGFSKLKLTNLELGPSNAVLFAAPEAELTLLPTGVKLDSLQFKQLELFECELHITRRKHEILLNGIPLPDFVQKLMELPVDSAGEPAPLKINAKLRSGDNSFSSNITIMIDCSRSTRTIRLSSRFESLADSEVQGSWEADLDLNSNQIAVRTDGSSSFQFIQEIMLRSRLPKQLIYVFGGGSIRGSGQFSAAWPSLLISDLKYNGSMADAKLNWYEHKIKTAEPWNFSLDIDQLSAKWQIPEIKFAPPVNISLKDLVLDYRKKQPEVKVSGKWDMTNSVVNFLCSRLHHPGFPEHGAPDTLEGAWDLRSGEWEITSSRQENKSGSIGVKSPGQLGLNLNADKLVFQSDGLRGRGQLTCQLEFRDLTLLPDAKSKDTYTVDRGTLFGKLHFGDRSKLVNDTLEFNFKTFSADTSQGHIELPGFAGELNLQRSERKKRDFFLICRGLGAMFVSDTAAVNSGEWQCTFSAESEKADAVWHLNGISLDIPQIKITHRQQPQNLVNLTVRGSGSSDLQKILSARLNIKADSFAKKDLLLKGLSAAIDYKHPAAGKHLYDVILQCVQAEFADGFHGIRNIRSGELKFSGNDFKTLPKNGILKAGRLTAVRDQFTLDFSNSSWVLQHIDTGKRQIKCSMEALSAASLQNKSGSGNFGKGSWDITIADDDTFAFSGTVRHPSWRLGELHIGGEEITANFKVSNDADLPISGSHTIRNANILGRYFTASTPLLSNVFSGKSRDSISGKIDFQAGSISSASGELELQKALLQLPWNISADSSIKSGNGVISSENLSYNGVSEGVFTGAVTHLLDPLKQTHTLSVNGKLAAEKFGKKPLSISGKLQLPPEKSAMFWQFELPETALTAMLPLKKYLPLPMDTVLLKGALAFNAQIECRPDRPAGGEIKYTAINSDWQIGGLTAEGVNDSGEMTIANGQYTVAPHNASINKIFWKNWEFGENELNWAINDDWQLHFAGWQGKIFDGKFRLTAPMQHPLADKATPANSRSAMQFAVEKVNAQKFFKQLKLGFIDTKAKLSGSVKSRLDNGKVYFDQSTLSADTPDGELLKLSPPAPDAIKVRDPQYRDFALAVLSAMKCYSTQFDFSLLPGEVSVKIKADGVPAAPVPFVYQGSRASTPFRRAGSGEAGFDGEIELNLNLKYHPVDPGV